MEKRTQFGSPGASSELARHSLKFAKNGIHVLGTARRIDLLNEIKKNWVSSLLFCMPSVKCF